MLESLSDLLAFPFVRNAIWAGLLASVLCGVIGTFVVVKRMVFIGGGISHAAFGGLGVCYYLGVEPLLGAALVAVLSAFALGAVDRRRERTRDAVIGISWALGMAVGIVFIYKTPGYAPNLMSYLFGNILTVGTRDLLFALALVALVLGLLVLFFKEFVAVSFDEVFAAVQGVPVRAVVTLLMALTALTVVLLIQLVGIILVIALLTIPPLIGLQLARDFTRVLAVATLAGALITLGGLLLSYRFDVPSGPAIVLLGFALLALVTLVRRRRRPGAREPARP